MPFVDCPECGQVFHLNSEDHSIRIAMCYKCFRKSIQVCFDSMGKPKMTEAEAVLDLRVKSAILDGLSGWHSTGFDEVSYAAHKAVLKVKEFTSPTLAILYDQDGSDSFLVYDGLSFRLRPDWSISASVVRMTTLLKKGLVNDQGYFTLPADVTLVDYRGFPGPEGNRIFLEENGTFTREEINFGSDTCPVVYTGLKGSHL